jgi:hypothetical protein
VARAIFGGLTYACVVFAFAFATGVLRTIALSLDMGLTPVAAVLIELPIILFVAWIVCGAVLRRMQVPARIDLRCAMGAVALVGIIALEFALATAMSGSSFAEFVASYSRPEVIVGLIGQIAFALFPLARMRR